MIFFQYLKNVVYYPIFGQFLVPVPGSRDKFRRVRRPFHVSYALFIHRIGCFKPYNKQTFLMNFHGLAKALFCQLCLGTLLESE